MSSFKYRVVGQMGLHLPAGMPVKLTAAQLQARAHLVAPCDGDADGYHACERDRLQFKRGEEIELLTELPKGQIVNGIVEEIGLFGEVVPPKPAGRPTPAPGQKRRRAAKPR